MLSYLQCDELLAAGFMLQVDWLYVCSICWSCLYTDRKNIVVSILGSDTASVDDRRVTFQGHIHRTT